MWVMRDVVVDEGAGECGEKVAGAGAELGGGEGWAGRP